MGRIAALFVATLLAVAPAARAACPGDCDGDGQVTVDELQKLVLIILRDPPDPCLAGDLDRNGRVTVEELIVAINAALSGCPPERTVTPTSTPEPPTPTPTQSPTMTPTAMATASVTPGEFIAQASDFDDVSTWTQVGRFRVTNKLGRLEEAVQIATALATTPGLQVPVGTIVQFIPGEAMVKRGGDFQPEHQGWEYFALFPLADRKLIVERGGIETSNGSCYGCHAQARTFDYICQATHNCGL